MEKYKLIHLAQIDSSSPEPSYLFLRKISGYHYLWLALDTHKVEVETSVWGATVEEAIRLAYRYWKLQNFSPLNCGFLYSLPERDEHGVNALFHQMVDSYASPTGIFFDKERGHNCIVQNSSLEARQLMKIYC